MFNLHLTNYYDEFKMYIDIPYHGMAEVLCHVVRQMQEFSFTRQH